MQKNDLTAGLQLLQQPVLPLVSMVQFLYLTGPFETVAEVVAELPEPIETGYTVYERPQKLLEPYLDILQLLHHLKNGQEACGRVFSQEGEPLDQMAAVSALVAQQVLTLELEIVNSALCGPCGCTLCCVGPEPEMTQSFFEIPLAPEEVALFPVHRIDTGTSRQHLSMSEDPLQVDGQPFYTQPETTLVHWQDGWSLILPTAAGCPNLESASGRCRVYADRPEVCRRPQIFAYILEPVGRRNDPQPSFRMRQSLLAVIDCPYVSLLRDEIAAYAAACELEMLFKENKA